MQTHDDRLIAQILHAEDLFLIEVGRLTLLFSGIEDCLANDALRIASISAGEELKEEAAAPELLHLRILEKRDLLKRVYADIGRYYGVDHRRLDCILDELGNLNRLRRAIVHGWIRWSKVEERPVFMDSRGQSISAWPRDVLDINMKVLEWYRTYYEEQRAVMGAVMDAYKGLAERLSAHPNLPPAVQELIAHIKARASEAEQP